jgi:hypothetical protein
VSRTKKAPLRPLTNSERRSLEQLARSQSAPALSVARARCWRSATEARLRMPPTSSGAIWAIQSPYW